MCGIVGILGSHEVGPIVLDALKRLEYRGYDSAGIATVHEGTLARRRATGKLINLQDLLVREPLRGFAGIGHTRWATHGAPTVANAHPHQAGPIAVVHNGIIENFRELRAELEAEGVVFSSQTDTEVIVQLANSYHAQGLAPKDVAQETLKRLEGAFALMFLFEADADLLIAARKGSPLVIGHGEGEMFVGSDAITLAPLTRKLTYLEDGDWAEITRNSLTIYDESGDAVVRAISHVELAEAAAEKSGYRHFMEKEMAEQPDVLSRIISTYLDKKNTGFHLPEGVAFSNVGRVIMVACGTAHYACHVAKYWFEKLARLPVEIDIASEFRYRNPVIGPNDMLVVVSQSGETADTLAALRHANAAAFKSIAVVNVPTSSIAREADVTVPILAGPEIGVASTKAFTAQLMTLLILAAKAGQDRGTIDPAYLAEIFEDIEAAPGLVQQALGQQDIYAEIASHLASSKDVLFLGRGEMYPIALEGALKLKEISYIHAEAYAAGELKHGPIALIEKDLPVVVFAQDNELLEKTLSNVQEVMARHGDIVMVSSDMSEATKAEALYTIAMPEVRDLVTPIVYSVPAQMLAYHTAIARGTDVDQPRNLAKSVTVE